MHPLLLNADRAGHGADTAPTNRLLHGRITESIIGSFYRVYDRLGYGFLENVYCGALTVELQRRGHTVARELAAPVYYEGVQVASTKWTSSSTGSLCSR
jgi:hypothetical protein